MRMLHPALGLLAVTALVLGVAGPAQARKSRKSWISVFSVPFACGRVTTTPSLLPGDYATTALVSNPDMDDATVTTRVALTHPGGQLVSEPVEEVLAPTAALQIDCEAILGTGFVFLDPLPPTEVVQGVLRVESRAPLSVSATTTSTGAGGDVCTDVTQIEPIRLRVKWHRNRDHKTTICHVPPGNPSQARTLRVGTSAVPAHKGHGDYVGPCDGR